MTGTQNGTTQVRVQGIVTSPTTPVNFYGGSANFSVTNPATQDSPASAVYMWGTTVTATNGAVTYPAQSCSGYWIESINSPLFWLGIPEFYGVFNGIGNGSGLTNCAVSFLTNWTTGVLLTNSSTLNLDITVPSFATSPATTIGRAGCSGLLQPPAGGGYVRASAGAFIEGGATSILDTNYATIKFTVPPGWGYCPCSNTDLSGTGYTAGLASTLTATLPWTNSVTIHP